MKVVHLGLVVATAALFGCATDSNQSSSSSASAQPAARTASSSAPAPAPHSARDITIGSGSGSTRTAPMMRSIYYAYDQSEITPESRKVIEANAEYLRQNPKVKVIVEGNADERGSAEYNVALGQRRADGVSKIMTLLGINSDRIESVSLGKEKPKVIGHDESAWSQNRRSDIVFK
ncbi:MAG TPA: peptidoglycan-associated lipoprotein Pal [Burkholderiales bacterium]|jgi:peptidoglycan-associated lipoprotein|nr:peptidoglycan-associated lipoprotein Pal [Burkholderiales bacterium]